MPLSTQKQAFLGARRRLDPSHPTARKQSSRRTQHDAPQVHHRNAWLGLRLHGKRVSSLREPHYTDDALDHVLEVTGLLDLKP
jgi:hypothetical protein